MNIMVSKEEYITYQTELNELKYIINKTVFDAKTALNEYKRILKIIQPKEFKSHLPDISAFLEAVVIRDPNTYNSHKRIYNVYKNWCIETNSYILSSKAFSLCLSEAGFVRFRMSTYRAWKYIKIKEPYLSASASSSPSSCVSPEASEQGNIISDGKL